MYICTGCFKSHRVNVQAYCLAHIHLIRKISPGMLQKISSLEECSQFSEIVHVFAAHALAMPGSHPFCTMTFWNIQYM